MIWEITKSYRYDPESIQEGKRLYNEFASRVILREIDKRHKERIEIRDDVKLEVEKK